MSDDPSDATTPTWRLDLVRPALVTIRGDPSMAELYRTRFQGRPAEVQEEGETVTIRYRRPLLSSERRRRPSLVVLNGTVPWRIGVHQSTAKVTSDLSTIQLRGFEVHDGGARELTLILPPPSGEVPIRIEGGAADVGIQRPSGVAIRFTATGGVSGLSLDDQRFGAVGGETTWHSQNYDGARDRYEVSISGGARAVTIDALGIYGGPARRQGRLLATVLFTDIVGSTERIGQLGDRRWRELLDRHDAAARRLVEGGNGTLVKTTGDGILAVFDGPGEAIRVAGVLREELDGMGIHIRAGVHTGEMEYRGDDVGGIAVHIGARIMDAAAPGEILVSRTVRDLVVGSEIGLEDRGTPKLRGVADDWRLYAVTR